jgi:hypothetical protein
MIVRHKIFLVSVLHVPAHYNFSLFLQVARCTKIISPNTDDAKYVINVKQIAKV